MEDDSGVYDGPNVGNHHWIFLVGLCIRGILDVAMRFVANLIEY